MNHRLHALQRQLGLRPAKAVPAPAATPADLASAIEALIDAKVAKALGNAPSQPASGPRLHDLERKLALIQPKPATPASRLYALDAQLAALGHAAPVNPPVRPLREVFEGIPAATKVSPLPATELVAPPPPRQRLIISGRDMNFNIKTLTLGTEGKPDVDITVVDRDLNGNIAALQVGPRLFRVFRDANGHIAEVVS